MLDSVQIIGVRLPLEVEAGMNLAQQIDTCLQNQGIRLQSRDVLVVAQKIVSKAEGRLVKIDEVAPSAEAVALAAELGGKNPREIQLILSETKKIVKKERSILITEHNLGFVMANAGIDKSNVPPGYCLLLPVDPDRSAQEIRRHFASKGENVAVIITDTFGRPWRMGQVNVAIGVSGLAPVKDYVGTTDRFGNILRHTQIAMADEIASAAELVMGKADGVPVVIVRGVRYENGEEGAAALVRPEAMDLFR